MASAWGKAWGKAWGAAFGTVDSGLQGASVASIPTSTSGGIYETGSGELAGSDCIAYNLSSSGAIFQGLVLQGCNVQSIPEIALGLGTFKQTGVTVSQSVKSAKLVSSASYITKFLDVKKLIANLVQNAFTAPVSTEDRTVKLATTRLESGLSQNELSVDLATDNRSVELSGVDRLQVNVQQDSLTAPIAADTRTIDLESSQ